MTLELLGVPECTKPSGVDEKQSATRFPLGAALARDREACGVTNISNLVPELLMRGSDPQLAASVEAEWNGLINDWVSMYPCAVQSDTLARDTAATRSTALAPNIPWWLYSDLRLTIPGHPGMLRHKCEEKENSE